MYVFTRTKRNATTYIYGLRILALPDNSAPKTLARRIFAFSGQHLQKLYQVVDLLEIYHPI
jgi:hypothetical protein